MPNQHTATALQTTAPVVILERYLSDETTRDIAKDYGVTPQALGKHLLKHSPHEWKEAQIARAIARKERAEDDLEKLRSGLLTLENGDVVLADAVSLACARERLKGAQWDLERVCRHIYGQNVDLTSKGEAIEAQDVATVARRVAFLLRKGTEDGEPEDAEIVAETAIVQCAVTAHPQGDDKSGVSD